MFRQPEQRIISAWYHCQREAEKCPKDNAITTSISHFAKLMQGTYVRMLLGKPHYWYSTVWFTNTPVEELQAVPVPTAEDTARAVERVREGFAFVGLTEQWDLSICLLHRMYGGRCNPGDFKDVRPGSVPKSEYNTSILEGFIDEHDGQVYAEGRRIFADHVQRFDVSSASCSPCFEEVGGR
mmetsp:Transcript_75664/g.208782  ORF Transcript_75664/g.208782 Transcript_75664/m.208782 type:complete len:182 (+) Transcript_75664:1-546(+)